MKDVVVIGGPNGAGKTTAAFDLLPKWLEIREFINADEIARGLSPFDPEGSALIAGRIMLDRIHALIESQQSFAFETTCASRVHVRFLKTMRATGYRVILLFLWLPSEKTAIDRVARRVREGGHRIPTEVIKRRYVSGLRNMLHLYLPLADIALIYDNSDGNCHLIAERHRDMPLVVHDQRCWKRIVEITR
jgi:predicted ABC-type ATPase